MTRLIALLVVVLASSPALAQEQAQEPPKERVLVKPSPRLGHYIALGGHFIGGVIDDEDRELRGPAMGWGLSLRLGERMTNWLDLGIRFSYARMGGDDPWTFGHLMITSQLYVHEQLFAHVGVGAGSSGGKDPDDRGLSRGSYSAAYTAGLGYNLYLSDADRNGGFITTPTVTLEYHPDSEFANVAVMLGIEISYWGGVSRNQLDLPIEEAFE